MQIYSQLPARRARQFAGDLWLVGWTAGWIWIAFTLHGLIMKLAAPGIAIAEGATSLATSIDSAGDAIGGVPLVGDGLSLPFDGMSAAARVMAAAGQAQVDAVQDLAFRLAAAVGLADAGKLENGVGPRVSHEWLPPDQASQPAALAAERK